MEPGTGPSLRKAAKVLARTRDSREFLLRNTREVIVICGQSIMDVHGGDPAAAKKKAARARSLLGKYRKKAAGGLAAYMTVPEQEFVEASALIAIYEKRRLPRMEELGVAPGSYVLGLLDCVGELKRMILDRIRAGESGEAERVFDIMEGLYLQLRQFALYDKVVKEARRKIDVCRILVDDSRAAVTEEGRRAELIRALGR